VNVPHVRVPRVKRPSRRLSARVGTVAVVAAVLSSYVGFIEPAPALAVGAIQNPTSICATAAFRALVIENQGYSGDALWTCASITNLNAVAHTLYGDCRSVVFKLSDTWNDCIASVQWWMPAGKRLQFWSEAGYSGALYEISTCGRGSWVGAADIPVLPGDYVSSIRFLSC
jgi:hypothetical protein